MNDLISRQAAIDGKISITCSNGLEIYSDEAVPVEYLQSLPSAQPYTDEEIQTMQDLEQAQLEKAYQIGMEEGLQSAQTKLNTQLYTDGFCDGYAQCKKDKAQWIPCSERLPKEKRQQYWICTDTGYQCQCRWTDNVYGFGPSDNWGWKIFDIPQYQKVVAWMPLPESWKEEQS